MNQALYLFIILSTVLPVVIFVIIFGLRVFELLSLVKKKELLVVARKLQEPKYNLISRSKAGLLSLLDAAYFSYKSGETAEAINIVRKAEKYFGINAYQMRIYFYLSTGDKEAAQHVYNELNQYRQNTGQLLFSKKSMKAIELDISSVEVIDIDNKIKKAGGIKEYTNLRIIFEIIYFSVGIIAGVALLILPVFWLMSGS